MASTTPAQEPGRTRRAGSGQRDDGPRTPRRLVELDVPQRRRAVLASAATVVLSWVLIFGAYTLLPFARESGLRTVSRLGADIALIGAVFSWQIRRIMASELPELRAVEALAIVIALFLAGFSGVYLGMSNQETSAFSQTLDHVRALYFTISVFSTVGFGDITAKTDSARLVVSAQMMLDLVIIGTVVRFLFNAARSRVSPAGVSPSGDPA